MLRISQQSYAAAAKSYYRSADYYQEGQELVGEWGGKAASALGLAGRVDREAFDSLCDNRNPRTGAPLTVRSKSERTVGYDFTFSVPKSVSLLYALTEETSIYDSFRGAVDETMRDIEAEMATRVRRNGRQEDRITGNAVWASFYHFTSRPVDGIPDPQLHAHCFVFNATFDAVEDRWKAGQFRGLKQDAPYWQAAFRARLADRLQAHGFSLSRSKDDFEIAGISPGTLKRFARRTAKIEATAEDLGISDPDRKSKLGAATREKKNPALGWSELQQTWRERLSAEEKSAVEYAAARAEAQPLPERSVQTAVDHALLHCFERRAVVPEKELWAEALRYGLGSVDVAGIREEFARRRLILGEVEGRPHVTTPEILQEEEQLVSFVRQGRGTGPALGGFDRALNRTWLNAEQQRAVRHLWESPDRVLFIRGAAGTGKTTLLQEAVEGIEANGRPVVVLAPSAEASRGVLRQEAGFAKADTVARFLVDKEMQESARHGVLLIDEASLLGARTFARVFALANELHARVILVGDPRQHGAVQRPGAFEMLAQRGGVPVIEVTDIRRQAGTYRDAVQLLSAGRTEEGFDCLDAQGWIQELPDAERYDALADDYLRTVTDKKANGELKTALVVSPTHAEASLITDAIRRKLHAAGKLGEERTLATWVPANLTEAERADPLNYQPGDMLQFHRHAPGQRSGSRLVRVEGAAVPTDYAARFQVYRPAELSVAIGDKLRITANGKTKDGTHRLNNGVVVTLRGFTSKGDLVVDHGWVIDRDFGHLTHGVVVTSHASQGRTVDRVLIGQSARSLPASSREQFYVSASRGRELMIYTDDKEAMRTAVGRGESRLLASQLLPPKPEPARPPWWKRLARLRRLLAWERNHEPVALAREPARVQEKAYER